MTNAPSLRSVDVDRPGGLRMHYVERGGSADRSVVFLHGWPDSSFSFSRVLPSMPEALRCLAVDQRGFGDTDRPESGYSIAEMAADVIGLLDAVQIERTVLVGHSFGSFVARQAAMAYPDRVSALVLIGTGFTALNATTGEVLASLRDLPDPIPEDFAREFQAGTIHHPVPPGFFDQLVVESLKLPPRLWRLTLEQLLAYDDSQQLPQLATRTLLLWGERDALFPRDDQDRLLTTLPRAQLKIYEDTGHCPNWERPERVAEDIAGFVSYKIR